jgi:3-oxoacyl-[acyl-carrier protein] reductase
VRVLVTGGTGVLGSEIVVALIESGFEVVANYSHDFQRASELQKRTNCEIFRADVTSESEVEQLFSDVQPQAVIHAVGWNQNALLFRTSAENWQKSLRLNVVSAFLVARQSLLDLPRGGQVILISSRVGQSGFAGQSAYAASKGAVLGLMKNAAIEGQERKIVVNAICPGFAVSALSQGISDEFSALRDSQNLIANSDAAQSLSAFCLYLLNCKAPPTGQIFRPDCRI